MPTYDYQCKLCGDEHEIFHSMSEGARKECPSCNKDGLEKQISSGSGIIFKGTGFYETDYKRKKSEVKESSGGKTCKDGKTKCCCE